MIFEAQVSSTDPRGARFLPNDGNATRIPNGTAIAVLDVFGEFSNGSAPAPFGGGTMLTADYQPQPTP